MTSRVPAWAPHLVLAASAAAIIAFALGLQTPGSVVPAPAQDPDEGGTNRDSDPLGIGDNSYRLVGEYHAETVRLAWVLKAWPEDRVGIVIRRRANGDNEWTTVTPPIRPGLSATKDLAAVEADPARRSELVRALQQRLMATNAPAGGIPPAEFIKLVNSPPAGFWGAMRRTWVAEFDYARMLGFACIIRDVPAGAHEYGLFSATADAVADAPLATWNAESTADADRRLRVQRLTVARRPNGTLISWSYPLAQVQAFGVGGFSVGRAAAGSDDFQSITPGGLRVGNHNIEGDDLVCAWKDDTADPDTEYRYAVALQSVFGRRWPVQSIVDYDPTAAVRVLDGPRITEVSWDPELRRARIRWSVPEGETDAIAGFRVERIRIGDNVEPDKRDFEPVETDPIAATATEAHDTDLSGDSVSAGYRVVALDAAGDPLAVSQVEVLVLVTGETPGAPQDVTADALTVNGTRGIRVSWTAPASSATITGYAVFVDLVEPGRLERIGGPISASSTSCFRPTALATGRELRVEVAALGSTGVEGTRAGTTVYAPGALLPAVENLRITPEGRNARVTWDYAAAVPDLLGFRVLLGAAVVATEDDLPADAREFVIRGVTDRAQFEVGVRAVARSGSESPINRVAHSTVPARADGTVAPPEGFRAEWSPDGTRMRLRWTPADGVDHYEAAIDAAAIGRFSRPSRVNPAAPGRSHYFNPVPNGSPRERSWNLRLWAVAEDGTRSLYSETYLVGESRTIPPAWLRYGRQTRTEDGISLLVRWQYPKAVDEPRSFRVTWTIDGRDDAGEPGSFNAAGTARSTLIGPFRQGDRITVVVTAEASDGSESEPSPPLSIRIR